jgi:hypothetical protein
VEVFRALVAQACDFEKRATVCPLEHAAGASSEQGFSVFSYRLPVDEQMGHANGLICS